MSRRGFSLAEVLITLMLFGITLGVIATMLRRVHHINEQSQQQQQLLLGVGYALQQLRSEMSEAVAVGNLPASADEPLIFRKINPQQEGNRLPRTGLLNVAEWRPFLDPYTVDVTYQVSNGELRRTSVPNSGAAVPDTSITATGVRGLRVEALRNSNGSSAPGQWSILLTVEQGGRILDLKTSLRSFVYQPSPL